MKKFILAFLLIGCVQPEALEYDTTCPGEGDYEFADTIVIADGKVDSVSAVNSPTNAINGVRGVKTAGSQDVLSRGYDEEKGNHILILEWKGREVLNGEGADFVVFENAFQVAENNNFMDLIVVSVSDDLVNWSTFPFDYVAPDETKYSHDPNDWVGFAGANATNYNSDDKSCLDPMNENSGGDKFDLDMLGENDPMRKGFRFLKLQSAPTLTNPDTSSSFVRDFISDGFDLDGVYARKTAER